jgi:Spermine/spermidine synthase domain
MTIVEVNETLIKHLGRQPFFQAIRRDDRVRWVIDDARRLLNREATTYDVVLMDPLRETTAYSNNIYSREFFELVRGRLSPGGVLMVWVQTLEQMNTLATVFAHAKMECSLYGLGSDRPLAVRRDVEPVIQAALPPRSVEAIRRRRGLCPYEEMPLVRDRAIPVLEDRKPILEYHLGRHYHTVRSRSRASGSSSR